MRRRTLYIMIIIIGAWLACPTVWASKPERSQSFSHFIIHLPGVPEVALENVKSRLNILEQNLPAKPSADDLLHFYEQGPEHIRQALAPYGYFHPGVYSSRRRQGRYWSLTYRVQPGLRLHFTAVHISIAGPGAHLPEFVNFEKNAPIKAGAPFNMKKYRNTKKQFFHIAETHGYIKGRLTVHQIRINKRNHRVVVRLQFATGEQYYFGPVHFNQTPFSEKLLRRYIPFKTGEPYSTDKILQFQNNLDGAGYFHRVNVSPKINRAKHYFIPIKVHLKPRKSQAYTFGIGYGTDTGARGTLGWNWRYLNASGHHMQALLQASQVRSNGSLSYVIPGRDPNKDQYYITLTGRHIEPTNARSTAGILTVGAIKHAHDWQFNLGINAHAERSKDSRNEVKTTAKLIYPFITARRMKAENPVYTRNGYQVKLTLQGMSKNLGLSNFSFYQAIFDAKYIHSVFRRNRIILRTDLGYTETPDMEKLPVLLQFYAGGSQSIRGYPFDWAGPGRYLAVGSAEFQLGLGGKWYATTYFDAGSGFNSRSDPFYRGAGAGIVRVTAIGPISLSIAHPFDKPRRKDRSWRIVFTMGPDLS
jgi:translocation and assembly module TamA